MPSIVTPDFSALIEPVSRDALRAFRREGDRAVDIGVLVVACLFAALFAVVVSVGVSVVIGGMLDTTLGAPGRPIGVALGIVLGLGFGALIVYGTIAHQRITALRRFRMTAFARANGLALIDEQRNPDYAGAIFHTGSSREAYDCLRAVDGGLEIGGYRYTTGSGKNQTRHHWGYLSMRIERALPHMVLDAKANNGLFGSTNLPESFARDQVLHLEGDFDRHFTLYCPSDYERDALYIFTPDLMALLIDDASAFDVEVVDDRLFAYYSGRIDTADPLTVRRLFAIATTVGAKTLDRAERYHDDRAGTSASAFGASDPARPAHPSMIAPQGRRLRQRVNVTGLVIGIAVVAAWAWMSFAR